MDNIGFGKNQFTSYVAVDTHPRRDDYWKESLRDETELLFRYTPASVDVVLCSRAYYYAFDHPSGTLDTVNVKDRRFVRSVPDETFLCGCADFRDLSTDSTGILSTSLSAVKPNITPRTNIHKEIVNEVVRQVKGYNDCMVIDMIERLTVKIFIAEEVLEHCECEECNAISESNAIAEREAEKLLVPASESSIKKLLKRVKVVAGADSKEEHDGHQRKRRRSAAADSKEEHDGRQRKRRGAKTPSANDDCPICSDEYTAGKYAVEMPCSHLFHGPCIRRWLRRDHHCPMCRYEMPTLEDEED